MQYVKVKGSLRYLKIALSQWCHPQKWLIKRSDEYPFYTMGRTAYLDKGDSYNEDREYWNDKMMGMMPSVYHEVLVALRKHLGEQVFLDKELAYPGLHIFDSHPAFTRMSGDWHSDVPHETLGLGNTDVMAWTYSIQMPEGGGGVDFINSGFIPHKTGYMVVHDGMEPHRIASFKKEGLKSRITMQGHIVRRREGPFEGKLVTFW